ncbi:uncharacterized membrane protein YjjB (DUF3815 family) [Staphylococcus saprophyticus]
MTLIYAFLFSFTASYFFAVIYDAPKNLFFAAGLAGASGYLISFILNDLLQIDSIYSSLLGSLTLLKLTIRLLELSLSQGPSP